MGIADSGQGACSRWASASLKASFSIRSVLAGMVSVAPPHWLTRLFAVGFGSLALYLVSKAPICSARRAPVRSSTQGPQQSERSSRASRRSGSWVAC